MSNPSKVTTAKTGDGVAITRGEQRFFVTAQSIGDLGVGGGVGPGDWTAIGPLQTADNVPEIDFDFPAGHRGFRVYFYNMLPQNNDVGIFVQLSNNGGSSFIAGAGYRSAAQGVDSLLASEQEGDHGSGRWGITEDAAINRAVGNDTAEGASGVIYIMDPLRSATRTRMRGQIQYTAAANTEWAFHFGGAHTTIETHNAVRLRFQTGDIVSGEFAMQGLLN